MHVHQDYLFSDKLKSLKKLVGIMDLGGKVLLVLNDIVMLVEK